MYQVDKMSLEETKENLDQFKHVFEYEQNNSYGIENRNYMTRISNNEVKNIAECNLPHDILIPPKRTKNLNIYYSPILHGCTNTRNGKEKFKTFVSYWTVHVVPRL